MFKLIYSLNPHEERSSFPSLLLSIIICNTINQNIILYFFSHRWILQRVPSQPDTYTWLLDRVLQTADHLWHDLGWERERRSDRHRIGRGPARVWHRRSAQKEDHDRRAMGEEPRIRVDLGRTRDVREIFLWNWALELFHQRWRSWPRNT